MIGVVSMLLVLCLGRWGKLYVDCRLFSTWIPKLSPMVSLILGADIRSHIASIRVGCDTGLCRHVE